MQSTLHSKQSARLHAAIIMDGNGRWATRRGLPRTAGHRAGVEALRGVIDAAPGLGIGTLTVYAFSADNWRRPPAEVDALMGLLRRYLESQIAQLTDAGVRLTIIGRRDRLRPGVVAAIAQAETATSEGRALHLRIAIDYSSRDAILSAAAAGGLQTREDFSRLLAGGEAPRDVDLVIRTSGEQRLSDFLLWECAYAELYFTSLLWPDFKPDDLSAAIADFHQRDRRMGGLTRAA